MYLSLSVYVLMLDVFLCVSESVYLFLFMSTVFVSRSVSMSVVTLLTVIVGG